MSENYTKRLDHELLIYASGIDLAVEMARAIGNYEYVVLPQKELTELTQYIREKVIDEPAIAENIKSLLRGKVNGLRSLVEHDDFGNGFTTTVPTIELLSACDMIDEVCK